VLIYDGRRGKRYNDDDEEKSWQDEEGEGYGGRLYDGIRQNEKKKKNQEETLLHDGALYMNNEKGKR